MSLSENGTTNSWNNLVMHRPANDRLPMVLGLALLVTFAQIAGLVAVGYGAFRELMSPTSPFAEYPYPQVAVVCHGELFYPVEDLKVNGARAILRAVDLKTGRVRVVHDSPFVPNRGLVTDGVRVWGVGDRDVLEIDGSDQTVHRPKRLLNTMSGTAFLYEGRPAVIDRDPALNERLFVFEEGDWQDRGLIAIPGENWGEVFDERLGGKVLIPPPSNVAKSTAPGRWVFTRVVSGAGKYHLFLQEMDTTGTKQKKLKYRCGFDFVADWTNESVVSALAPENAPAVAAGWIETDIETSWVDGIVALGNEVIIATTHGEVWERTDSKGASRLPKFSWSNTKTIKHHYAHYLIPDLDTKSVLALKHTRDYGMEVHRFGGTSATEPLLRIEGYARWTFLFWGRTLLKALGVMALGNLVLVWLGSRLVGGADEATYSFGTQTVRLASLKRRSLARLIDVSIWLAPLATMMAWWVFSTPYDRIYSFVVDELVRGVFSNQSHDLERLFFFGCFGAVFVAPPFLILLWIEAYTGSTPGKWLCGIRTVRTTLRPIDFTRTLLRLLLLWIDLPLLLWPVPGVCTMICTDRRQRLGDLVADTVVVEHDSQKKPAEAAS